MLATKQEQKLSQQHLLKILEDIRLKGSESTTINSKQVIDDIVMQLKPYIMSK